MDVIESISWITAATTAFLVGALLVLFLFATLIHRTIHVEREVTRKLVHVVGTGLGGVLPLVIDDRLPLFLFAVVTGCVLVVGARAGWFGGVIDGRRTMGGPLWLLVAYAAMALFVASDLAFATAFWVLAFADASASLVGFRAGGKSYSRVSGRTWAGTVAFAAVAAVVVIAVGLGVSWPWMRIVAVACLVACVTAAIEGISPSSFDNFSIPIVAGFLFVAGEAWSFGDAWWHLAELLVASGVSIFGYRRGWLTADGALAAMAMVVCSMVAAGEQVGFLFAICLAAVSLATRFQPEAGTQGDSKGRSARQILAFSLLPVACAVLDWKLRRPWLSTGIVVGMAAALSDTWATEIGKLSHSDPRLITTGKQVPKGTSGGVTTEGLAGAVLGALIASSAGAGLGLIVWPEVVLTVSIGVAASLFDSLLGAVVQGQYECGVCGKRTEFFVPCHGKDPHLFRGARWLDNEGVNFLASAWAVGALGLWTLLEL